MEACRTTRGQRSSPLARFPSGGGGVLLHRELDSAVACPLCPLRRRPQLAPYYDFGRFLSTSGPHWARSMDVDVEQEVWGCMRRTRLPHGSAWAESTSAVGRTMAIGSPHEMPQAPRHRYRPPPPRDAISRTHRVGRACAFMSAFVKLHLPSARQSCSCSTDMRVANGPNVPLVARRSRNSPLCCIRRRMIESAGPGFPFPVLPKWLTSCVLGPCALRAFLSIIDRALSPPAPVSSSGLAVPHDAATSPATRARVGLGRLMATG